LAAVFAFSSAASVAVTFFSAFASAVDGPI